MDAMTQTIREVVAVFDASEAPAGILL